MKQPSLTITGTGPILILTAIFMLAFVGLVSNGCTTNQERNAYNTLYSVQVTTTATVDGYYSATIKGLVSTNGIPQVSKAYNDFQKAFIVAIDAAQFNTNALAPASLQQESADVIALVGQFYHPKTP
ncbi:MAG TPA: hypothetical protein VLK33_23245 [Terriglobales bacterium]|nr:hypothetical protein [Terriglobales bacterium]